MPDKKDYRHTLRICNTYSFPQQKWLRERASILRSYVNCRSCYSLFSLSISSFLPSLQLSFIFPSYLSFSSISTCSRTPYFPQPAKTAPNCHTNNFLAPNKVASEWIQFVDHRVTRLNLFLSDTAKHPRHFALTHCFNNDITALFNFPINIPSLTPNPIADPAQGNSCFNSWTNVLECNSNAATIVGFVQTKLNSYGVNCIYS